MGILILTNKIVNSANYSRTAAWNNSLLGNVTTVGSNGGPSYYGTYDQSGNVHEWNDSVNSSGTGRGRRGGDYEDTLAARLSSTEGRRVVDIQPSFVSPDLGFRISTVSNNNMSNFVMVGDINNTADSATGFGSVGYVYKIGKYPVTNFEYVEFLNAIAKTDTYSLYDANMGVNIRGGITRTGTAGSYLYSLKPNMGNKPVNYLNWFRCARYCNWLHNNKSIGAQDSSTTEDGAYTLNGANTTQIILKNNSAIYWIPTENEWYKAAYYTPDKNGSGPGYWKYATQSDSDPVSVIANSVGDGVIPANVVKPCAKNEFISNSAHYNYKPALGLTNVGTNGGPSYYGTYDQFGLSAQWVSNKFDNVYAYYFSQSYQTTGYNMMFDTAIYYPPHFTVLFREARMEANIMYGDRDMSGRICTKNNPLNLPNFVLVENINNIKDDQFMIKYADRFGANFGSVSYIYYIGKYLITVKEYLDFLNAIGATDTYMCYRIPNYSGIVRSGTAGSYSYVAEPSTYNLPCVSLSYHILARYCNWLHNGKPNGAQNPTTTEDGAYLMNNIYSDGFNWYTHPNSQGSWSLSMPLPLARDNPNYWIPDIHEWYKAGCYDPTLNGGLGGYWAVPTMSNDLPLEVTKKNPNNDGLPYRFLISN